jgi:hypothetical protein
VVVVMMMMMHIWYLQTWSVLTTVTSVHLGNSVRCSYAQWYGYEKCSFLTILLYQCTVSTLTRVSTRDVNCISTMVVDSLSNFYNNIFIILSYKYHLLLPTAIMPHTLMVEWVDSIKTIIISTGSDIWYWSDIILSVYNTEVDLNCIAIFTTLCKS